jgi:hypothetical protein
MKKRRYNSTTPAPVSVLTQMKSLAALAGS